MDNTPATGRACGSCMMCCKLPRIKAFDKPPSIWCRHAKLGSGCSIYDTRPDECCSFLCDWMRYANLGPEWQPSVAKFLTYISPSNYFVILPDAGYPNSWKAQPYYPTLKIRATKLIEIDVFTIVVFGEIHIVLFPDRDETIRVRDDEEIAFRTITYEGRRKYEVYTEKR